MKTLGLILGIAGMILVLFSLTDVVITGAVIGVSSISKFLGILGIVFLIITGIIGMYENTKKK